MNRLQELIEQIGKLEKELYVEIQKKQDEFYYRIKGRKVYSQLSGLARIFHEGSINPEKMTANGFSAMLEGHLSRFFPSIPERWHTSPFPPFCVIAPGQRSVARLS